MRLLQRFCQFAFAKRIRMRLSREEALAIAATAYAGRMVVLRIEQSASRALWVIGTPTVGSGHVVVIDDATGTIIANSAWGIR